MKKTFSLSISGRIFQVEEDAYALLLDYLDSLSQIFKGPDGQEIVDDIEARISDIFQEQKEGGKVVFTIADAEQVIAVIGNAAEIAEESEEGGYGREAQAAPSQAQAQATGQGQAMYGNSVPPIAIKRKLYRSQTDKVLGGVFGGLAVRIGVSVLPMRIIMVLLMFPLGFFPVFLIYCIAWAVIPLANTPERVLEQQGRPVTVANIGDVLSTQAARQPIQEGGTSVLRVLGALIMGFTAMLAGIVGVCMLVAIFALLACVFAVMFGAAIPFGMLDMAELSPLCTYGDASLAYLAGLCVCLAILIPCIALVWAACSVLFKAKGASRSTWIVALVVEAIAIIVPAILFAFIG